MRARTIGRIGPIAVEDYAEPGLRVVASRRDFPKGGRGEIEKSELRVKIATLARAACVAYITENTTELVQMEFWRGTTATTLRIRTTYSILGGLQA